MRQTFKQTYNEIKAAYAPTPEPKKVHGEDVITFEVRCQTPWVDKYYSFDAPRCSSNDELTKYALTQSRGVRDLINLNQVGDVKLSFRVKTI
jgi:hypothetical protein